jgi:hypothetical protein
MAIAPGFLLERIRRERLGIGEGVRGPAMLAADAVAVEGSPSAGTEVSPDRQAVRGIGWRWQAANSARPHPA